MSKKHSRIHTAVAVLRLLAQMTAIVLTLVGMGGLLRNLGLPGWLFASLVVVAGMFFCGWVCAFGALQEWLRKAGKRMTGFTLRIPAHIDRYLLLSRYAVMLVGMFYLVSVLNSRRTFTMLVEGRAVGFAACALLAVILMVSLFMDRPFCKYLCGHGALAGLTSMFRLVTVRRDNARCVGCAKCDRECMMGVEVSKAHAVRDPNCIQCGKCLAACPVPDALKPALALPCLSDARALRDKYKHPSPAEKTKKAA